VAQTYQFELLAPDAKDPHWTFGRPILKPDLYMRYLIGMQKLRGRLYLTDGAIKPNELDDEGRFPMQGDDQAWHLLLVDETKRVIGCVRYLVHANTESFENLRISHCAMAADPVWGPRVRAAVERDLAVARQHGFFYVEIGGWALAEEWRGTRAALEILAGSYALARLWGGCLGACTATVRHGSASMLRRIGGSSLQVEGAPFAVYEDPRYGCAMELLKFDYRTHSPRYASLIQQLCDKLSESRVISAGRLQRLAMGDVARGDISRCA
jgi:hypothetical protein